MAAHHGQALGSLTQELHVGRAQQRATGAHKALGSFMGRRKPMSPLGFPGLSGQGGGTDGGRPEGRGGHWSGAHGDVQKPGLLGHPFLPGGAK